MKSKFGYCLITTVVFLAACGTSKDKTSGSSGSGNIGEAGDSGSGNIGEAGDSSGGSSATGGSSTTGGSSSSTGGSSSAGSSTGGSSGTAGSSGAGAQEVLLGPVMDDQPAILVGVEHSGFPDANVAAPGAGPGEVMFEDSTGNVFLTGRGMKLYKFPASLSTTPLWTFTGASITGASMSVLSASLAADDGVFIGGSTNVALPGETAGGLSDAVVGKLNANGTVAWVHQWGSSSNESTGLTRSLSDGSVIAGGASDGQAPGNPSTSARGFWLARYSATGTRLWLKQYQSTLNGVSTLDASTKLLVDKNDNAYFFFGSAIGASSVLKVETAHGNEISRYSQFDGRVMNSPKDTMYGWRGGSLEARELNAFTVLYSAQTEPPRTAVLDPVENVIWTGRMSGGAPAAGADALYLSGGYSNTYKNGSIVRPQTTHSFVGRYDLDGTRVWFQELVFGSDSGGVFNQVNRLLIDISGNVLVAADTYSSSPETGGGYLFKLSAADGAVM